MRTTLDIDEDLVEVARDLAAHRKTSMGRIVSELMRAALTPPAFPKTRNGVPLLRMKPGARPLSLSEVNRLRDEE